VVGLMIPTLSHAPSDPPASAPAAHNDITLTLPLLTLTITLTLAGPHASRPEPTGGLSEHPCLTRQ